MISSKPAPGLLERHDSYNLVNIIGHPSVPAVQRAWRPLEEVFAENRFMLFDFIPPIN